MRTSLIESREIGGSEAIEIVRALRNADADAFVYETAAGPMVSVLDGTAEPYRLMVDAIGEGAAVLDADGIILFANPSMGRLVGKSAAKLVGIRLGDFMSSADALRFKECLPELMNGGTLDVKLRRSRRSVPVHLSSRPISFEGFAGAIIVATDYSALQDLTDALERRVLDRTAELRLANESLQDASAGIIEANRHKTIFLTNMSHELRTPLNAIIGFSELLLTVRDKPYDDKTQIRFLEQILLGGRNLLNLINDILDLSKVEAGQMELRPKVVNVRNLVDETVGTVEPMVRQKRMRVAVVVDDALEITADPGKLRQMILNLLSNAIKFSGDGTTVTIRAQMRDDWVDISVADTGIGIRKADQLDIFKEFHQVETPGRRPQQGTGLGLALTERFAALHGGTVHLVSDIDKGSVFTISLPARGSTPAVVESPVEHATDRDLSKPLILIIEDDPAAAELMKRQLGGAGFRTVLSRTGGAGLVQARELHPAAVTIDIMLPDMDGWEVITLLKKDPRTVGIPIMVVSVIDNPELGLALGTTDYLVKPVVASELIKKMHQIGVRNGGASQRTVLVVDDEATHRNWLLAALEPAGYCVLQAGSGREAIDVARNHSPNVILLDLLMPGLSGFDVIEALNLDEATRKIPIVVISSAEPTAAEKKYLKERVSSILRRGSVGAADLLSLLRTTIEQPGR